MAVAYKRNCGILSVNIYSLSAKMKERKVGEKRFNFIDELECSCFLVFICHLAQFVTNNVTSREDSATTNWLKVNNSRLTVTQMPNRIATSSIVNRLPTVCQSVLQLLLRNSYMPIQACQLLFAV